MSDATTKTKTAPARKGNTQTEMIIGSAVKDLQKVIDSANASVEKVAKLAEEAEKQQSIIAQREDQIKELDVKFAETKRQKEVQMELDLQQNERKAVDSILDKQGLVAVSRSEYEKFNAGIAAAKTEAEADAKKEIAIATNSMKKQHENELALAKADFETKQATANAKLENANSQIEFLNSQVKMWKDALDAERNASVERAKASAIGTVSINGASK